ncbi:hypothetical protein LTR08_000792 [Meristemomyces frigidus]|nr:hypothetical protein LTR08_000792 [Meristemomyces frigidus]
MTRNDGLQSGYRAPRRLKKRMDEKRLLELPAELRTLLDFFENDDRPSAILEVEQHRVGGAGVVYQNSAFSGLELGRATVEKLILDLAHAQQPGRGSPQVRKDGRLWRYKSTGQGWASVVCVDDPYAVSREYMFEPAARDGSAFDTDTERGHVQTNKWQPCNGDAEEFLDWTRFDIAGLPHYTQFMRSFDWSVTGLGAMETWPIQFRQMIVPIMMNPYPRCVAWGQDHYFIYNAAAAPLFGKKHPACLGQPIRLHFVELYDDVGPLFDAAYDGKMINLQRMPLTMERSEIQEETYWDFTLLPIFGPDGRSVGVNEELMDVTSIVRGERRRTTVLRLSEHINSADTLKNLWLSVLAGLEPAVEDVPFAMCYAVVDKCPPYHESDMQCVLQGTVGMLPDKLEQTFNLTEPDTGSAIAEIYSQVWRTKRPVMLSSEDGSLPPSMAFANPTRAFGHEVQRALVTPINSIGRGEKNVLAILIIGLNPMCPYDHEYSSWTQLVVELAEKAAAMISLPEEQRRAKKAADDLNTDLARRLHMTTLQAERNEARFVQMASSAPTGMYLFDKDGIPLIRALLRMRTNYDQYVNNAYLELIGETREQHANHKPDFASWSDVIHPDDSEKFRKAWVRATECKMPVTVEYRLKRPWRSVDRVSGHEIQGETWLSANAVPCLDADGNVLTVQGWLTDISHRKFSENLLAQRLEDALENKRQSENFIDMTSHEMRNPLSAILQSADSIISTLDQEGMPMLHEAMKLSSDVAEEIVDAAQTIILCAQHQKRIVDDILTLSKLDASLLVISPDKVQPPLLIGKALKMYLSETSRADITVDLCIEKSYTDLRLDWVVLDSSRLLQVIINLLTNSIKFTQYSDTRKITVCVGASHERPTGKHHGIKFIPVKNPRQIQTSWADWGDGEELWLQIAVLDTGRGLTEEEIRLLFKRFSQASAKTEKQYGGSGLGLFISRELCELQGGQIGVSSVAGKTTFSFFVKTKRWLSETDTTPVKAAVPTFVSASNSPIAYGRRGSSMMTEVTNTSTALDRQVQAGLPVKQEKLAAQPSIAAQPSVSATTRKTSVAEKQHGLLHVLIVEDNLINQKIMSQQLRKAGCIVHVANHGLECISFIETSTFCGGSVPLSVVLLDLEMPIMDGLTCIQRIRKQQASGEIQGHVPVIAVTANARSEQIATAIEAGMDQVVTKPFRIPELVPQMKALLAEFSQRGSP